MPRRRPRRRQPRRASPPPPPSRAAARGGAARPRPTGSSRRASPPAPGARPPPGRRRRRPRTPPSPHPTPRGAAARRGLREARAGAPPAEWGGCVGGNPTPVASGRRTRTCRPAGAAPVAAVAAAAAAPAASRSVAPCACSAAMIRCANAKPRSSRLDSATGATAGGARGSPATKGRRRGREGCGRAVGARGVWAGGGAAGAARAVADGGGGGARGGALGLVAFCATAAAAPSSRPATSHARPEPSCNATRLMAACAASVAHLGVAPRLAGVGANGAAGERAASWMVGVGFLWGGASSRAQAGPLLQPGRAQRELFSLRRPLPRQSGRPLAEPLDARDHHGGAPVAPRAPRLLQEGRQHACARIQGWRGDC